MSTVARRNIVYTWLAAISVTLLWLGWNHASAARQLTSFDELSVHRINVIEPDGKPRVIIANRPSMAGAYWGGKEYQHIDRDWGGMLFFNDNGDEIGGLMLQNRQRDDGYSASTSLLFDQYQQDQTLGLSYSERDGKRQAGLTIWDQPDESVRPFIEMSDRARRAASAAERERITAELRQKAKALEPFRQRFFAGKSLEESILRLHDAAGRPRLVLKVDGAGSASVEFLDAAGKVVNRIAAP